MTFSDDDSPTGRRSVFTDLDLKRLKEQMVRQNYEFSEYIHGKDMQALLDRLEAGETALNFRHSTEHCSGEPCTCGTVFADLYVEWRKAAGK